MQSEFDQNRSFGDKSFNIAEFHIVDLEQHTIHLNVSSQLLNRSGLAPMLSLGDSVYIFGGYCTQKEVRDIASCVSGNPKDTFYMGSARLQFVSNNVGKWCQNPKPIFGPVFPNTTCLLEKIYNMGFDDDLSPQVFDPATNLWDEITVPSDLQGCSMSSPVLPDPNHNRIILHLEEGPLSSPSLYAFYPMSHEWKPIVSNFTRWDPVAAVADDVIYFYNHKCPTLVRAYDLKQLKWVDVHLSETLVDGYSIVHGRFKELLYLGDTSFCLVGPSFQIMTGKSGSISKSGTNDDNDRYLNCRVSIVKFRIERTGSVITLIPLSASHYILPHTCYFCNTVALP